MNRGWIILTFIVLFNISIIVVGALDVYKLGAEGTNPLSVKSNITNAITEERDVEGKGTEEAEIDYFALLQIAGGIIVVAAAAILRLPVASIIYAALFTGGLININGFFNNLGALGWEMMPAMETFLTAVIILAFLGGFIDFAR